jgi:hypothetical protein
LVLESSLFSLQNSQKQTDTAAGKSKETIDRPETEDDWWGSTWCDAKILALLGSCPLT